MVTLLFVVVHTVLAMTDSEMDRRADEWLLSLGASERADPIWKLRAYSLARFALRLASADVRDLAPMDGQIGNQLIRSVSSVSANIGEGFGRPSYADQARFYSYALGSVREAITWYAAIEPLLGAAQSAERAEILSRVRRLTFGLLRAARALQGKRAFGE